MYHDDGGIEMICYKENTLVNVIYRVDFQTAITVEGAELHEMCLAQNPVFQKEEVRNVQTQVTIDDRGQIKQKNNEEIFTNRKYMNRQMNQTIQVSPKYMVIQMSAYESYDKTKELFCRVFREIMKNNENAVIQRIGMRYINEIDISAKGKRVRAGYVKPALYSNAFGNVINEEQQTRTQHLVEWVIDDFRIRAVTGFFNADYPSTIRRKIVTLDYDAYIDGGAETSEVESYLDKFHEKIQQLFEAAITDKQRAQMVQLEG